MTKFEARQPNRQIVFIILAFIGFAAFASYGIHRLQKIEGTISSDPPSEYKMPDLSQIQATEQDLAAATARGAVYVPVYSHVYFDGGRPCLMETTLSIRNIDHEDSVLISQVDYFNTSGEVTEHYLGFPIRIAPMHTVEFLALRRETAGGSGANFVVRWAAGPGGTAPLIEAVMIGNNGSQGYSLLHQGVPMPASADFAAQGTIP